MFERFEKYAKLAQSIAIILGVFGGMTTLIYSQYEKKLARTIEFNKEYSSGIRKEYPDLLVRWNRHVSKHGGILNKDKAQQEQVTLAFFNVAENEKTLLRFLDFYDVLMVCIENRVCDRNSAIDLFRNSSRYLFEISAYYIVKTRKSDRDSHFGLGLEAFYNLKPEAMLARFI